MSICSVWVHRAGRCRVADPLSYHTDFVGLNALLAVMSRSVANKSLSSVAAPLGQMPSRDVPASGANTVPAGKRRKLDCDVAQTAADTPPLASSSSYDPADPAVVSVAEPTTDQLISQDTAPSSNSAVDTDLADEMHDATVIDDIIEAYAAEPFFVDENTLQACRSLRVFGRRKAA